jgi:hypothetical protein
MKLDSVGEGLIKSTAAVTSALTCVIVSVFHLFRSCCPTTVIWRIAFVVILSINAMIIRRTRPHIGIKRGKIFKPSVAYGNTPSPISIESPIRFRIAPTFHIAPYAIFRRSISIISGSESVSGRARDDAVNPLTPAGFRMSASQSTTVYRKRNAAYAGTKPTRRFPFILSTFNYSEPVKCFTG